MALIPSHIRFALDTAKNYIISDYQQYISGTVYPDSRWQTGIDRELTHHADFLEKTFPTDDFTLGWHLHCIYDELQKQIHQPILENFKETDRKERWITSSILKVIQDRYDLQQIDLTEHLHRLNYFRNPNGEPLNLIRQFYSVMRRTYSANTVPTPQDYGRMWMEVGLDSGTTETLVFRLGKALSDRSFCTTIEKSHEAILTLFYEQYGS